MRKSNIYKITGSGSGVIVVIGTSLVTTLLPGSNWVTQEQSQLGTIIGICLILIGAPLSLYFWWNGIKLQKEEENKEIGDIKDNLIDINKYERAIANKITQEKFPTNTLKNIHNDFMGIINENTLISMFTDLMNNNIDSTINFLKKFGDILDANGCGLKAKLDNYKPYQKTNLDLLHNRIRIHANSKKKHTIQENIDRLRSLIYGLNSAIILRNILKPLSESASLPIRIILITFEGIESICEKNLSHGLDNIDKKWEYKLRLGEVENQLKTLLSSFNFPNNN